MHSLCLTVGQEKGMDCQTLNGFVKLYILLELQLTRVGTRSATSVNFTVSKIL